MRGKLLTLLVFLLIGSVTAHEFWLEPRSFRLRRGETLKVRFLAGERFEGENWKGDRQGVERISLFYNGMEDTLTELIPRDTPGDSLALQFFDEGTGLLGYHSQNKWIELDPARFLEYLKEDGLDNAIAYREQHQETDSTGKEYYQRCAKTIFQVGASFDETYRRNCRLPLEFIPLEHPYKVRKGQSLPFQLLFRNEPLAGARIRIWHRLNGKTDMKEALTSEEGRFSLEPSLAGTYMVSTVRMEHIDSSAVADWQSYWGSLTWGY